MTPPFWKKLRPSFTSDACISENRLCEAELSGKGLDDLFCWIEIRSHLLIQFCTSEPIKEVKLILDLQQLKPSKLLSKNSGHHLIELRSLQPHEDKQIFVMFTNEMKADDFIHQCRSFCAPITLSELEPISTIGRGRWGKIILCSFCSSKTMDLCAVKEIDCQSVEAIKYVQEERITLELVGGHPFVIQMRFAMQARNRVYIILDFEPGGDFYTFMTKNKITYSSAVFYTSQLLLALQHLHRQTVVHRDIKPENILLDCRGNLRLADFGLAKILRGGETTNTICGTDSYLAPEMLGSRNYSFSVDYWQFGCFVYEIFVGHSPFYHHSLPNSEQRRLIEQCVYYFPARFPAKAKLLVEQILVADPMNRLGSSSEQWQAIKSQDFFGNVDWEMTLARKIKPPIKTVRPGFNVLENFDDEFLNENCCFNEQDTDNDSLAASEEQFLGFNYCGSFPTPTHSITRNNNWVDLPPIS